MAKHVPGLGSVDPSDLFKQGARFFVPAIGIAEGAWDAISTGSSAGAAKFFAPGIGIVEGAVGGGVDLYRAGGSPIQNATLSTGTLLLLAAAVGITVWSITRK